MSIWVPSALTWTHWTQSSGGKLVLRAVPGSRMNAGGHHGPVNGPGPGPVCDPYPAPTPVALTEHHDAK